MNKKDAYTVPNPTGKGWVNKVGGKLPAVIARKGMLRSAGGRLPVKIIVNTPSTEERNHWRKNSCGSDPNPPHDKNR